MFATHSRDRLPLTSRSDSCSGQKIMIPIILLQEFRTELGLHTAKSNGKRT